MLRVSSISKFIAKEMLFYLESITVSPVRENHENVKSLIL